MRSVQKTWIALGFMTLVGCSGSPMFQGDPSVVILPGPPGAPKLTASTADPRSLPGVDTSALVERERKVWWKLVTELCAPCSDQAVSIAACVEQSRSCATCAPAAKFLAQRVQKGSSMDEASSAY